MPTMGGATATGPPRIAVTLSDPRRAVEPDLQRQKNGLYLQAVVGAGGDPIPLDAAWPSGLPLRPAHIPVRARADDRGHSRRRSAAGVVTGRDG